MKTSYIIRVACRLCQQLIIWCTQISVCIVLISLMSMTSTEYDRVHSIETQRVRNRRIASYYKTGHYTPTADIAEIHSISIDATAAYIVNTTHLINYCLTDSTCWSICHTAVAAWIDNQETVAWSCMCMFVIIMLVQRCPLFDIRSRVASEIACNAFQKSIITNESHKVDAK